MHIHKVWESPKEHYISHMTEWWSLENKTKLIKGSVQFSSVAQSCPTLCNPMDCNTPGLPVHHQLPEFTQTHVHLSRWCYPTISSSVIPFFDFKWIASYILKNLCNLSIKYKEYSTFVPTTQRKKWNFTHTFKASHVHLPPN